MGGGSGTQSQQTNQLPSWAQPFSYATFQNAQNAYFPTANGGNQLPAAASVAALSPDTLAAMQMVEQLSGVQPNAGQGYINPMFGPNSNQFIPPGGTSPTPIASAMPPGINTPPYQVPPQNPQNYYPYPVMGPAAPTGTG